MVGKNASQFKLGYGVFMFYDIPVNSAGNKSVRIELMDLSFFPEKNKELENAAGYLSIKLGYKRLFSETKTGFYVEPQLGYCRLVYTHPYESEYGDGIAAAIETGYSLEVGSRGNTLNAGLKYETDRVKSLPALSSLALRFSYSFGLFKRRNF